MPESFDILRFQHVGWLLPIALLHRENRTLFHAFIVFKNLPEVKTQ